ncbi:MAG TPA: ATP synthase F1 subunit delta [Dehalococcoidia bacterium]|nr:ATP synthase F1 subunit delta [Dehalococcoidia bacterium]
MPVTTSARRYAQAVFELAQESDKLQQWRQDLRKIAELVEDTEFIALVENPKLPFEVKTKLVQERLKGIDQLARNLVCLLVAKGRLKNADQIANEYERLLNDYCGIAVAEVVTAIPLDEVDKEELNRHLEAIAGRKVNITLQVDPAILGGFVARIDDTLIDGSLRNKLSELKKTLVEAEL